MADSTITLRVVGDASAAPKAPDAAPATAPPTPRNPPAAAPQAPGGAPAAAATPGLGPAAPAASPAGGKSLAGPLAAFALGWGAQQLLGLGVNALASTPGRQRQANWLANVGGGALSGATAGAALGGAVGAGVGAAIGAGVGALNALADAAKGARDALEAIKARGHDYALATGARRQDEAFARTLGAMGREERLGAIADRADAIKNGPGELAIANLEKWLKTAADNGETDTEEYRRKEGALALQYQRLGALDQAYDQTEATPPPGLLDPGSVADSLAKIGGSVGPSVDVADVNRDLLATLRDFFQAWRTRAGLDPASAKGIDAASGFAPHATFG